MTNLKDYENFISLPIQDRIGKAQKYSKHKNRIPIVIINRKGEIQLKGIKYLVSKENTVARLSRTIRKNNDLKPDQVFQLMVNQKFLSPQQKMITIFDENKSDDGFLYVELIIVEAFGNRNI